MQEYISKCIERLHITKHFGMRVLCKALKHLPQDHCKAGNQLRTILEQQLFLSIPVSRTPEKLSRQVPASSTPELASTSGSTAKTQDQWVSNRGKMICLPAERSRSSINAHVKQIYRLLHWWLVWPGISNFFLGAIAFGLIIITLGCNRLSAATFNSTAPVVGSSITTMPTSTGTPEHTATNTPLPTLTSTETQVPTVTATLVPTPTSTVELNLEIGSTLVNPADTAMMVYVPEGDFLMGSEDSDASSSEAPEHQVWLDAFWIYQTEVTNGQYRQCVEDGACELPGNITNYQNPFYSDYPVGFVSWFKADSYCQWAGGQLPTEAEWEKAARGTDGRKYPWGNEPVTGYRANYCDINCQTHNADTNQNDGYERISPVGRYPNGASPYGALDMAGNMWEWVADWYSRDYYSRAAYENPIGPTSGDDRVVHGGSWTSLQKFLRGSFRSYLSPDGWWDNLGFRCISRITP